MLAFLIVLPVLAAVAALLALADRVEESLTRGVSRSATPASPATAADLELAMPVAHAA